MPWNHAARAKSNAPGTAMGGGGISQALTRTVAPGVKAGSASSSLMLMRSRDGRSVGGNGATTSRTASRAGSFCVSVLTEAQRDVSSVFGRGGADKFGSVTWRRAPSGSPILDGALAWIDCSVEAVHEAGDHYIVVGRVHALGDHGESAPLLFYRGTYGSLAAESALEPDAELDELLTWSHPDDWI